MGVDRIASSKASRSSSRWLPYVLRLADNPRSTLVDDEHLRNGLNVADGHITNQRVADSLGLEYVAPLTIPEG